MLIHRLVDLCSQHTFLIHHPWNIFLKQTFHHRIIMGLIVLPRLEVMMINNFSVYRLVKHMIIRSLKQYLNYSSFNCLRHLNLHRQDLILFALHLQVILKELNSRLNFVIITILKQQTEWLRALLIYQKEYSALQ